MIFFLISYVIDVIDRDQGYGRQRDDRQVEIQIDRERKEEKKKERNEERKKGREKKKI